MLSPFNELLELSGATATTMVAGVDTHKDFHVVAVLNVRGSVVSTAAFAATTSGYAQLLDHVTAHGFLARIGVESTSAYGAGLTRFLIDAGMDVIDVPTTDKAIRARRGKTDVDDASAAARYVLGGAGHAPKNSTGIVESIRMLVLVRSQAVKNRTAALNQIAALVVTAPADLQAQLRGCTNPRIAKTAATFRPDRTRLDEPLQAAKVALKRLGERVRRLDTEIADANVDLDLLVASAAPSLLALHGVGTHHAAQLLLTAAQNIDRISSPAAFTRLCGAAPIPVSSGRSHRMRLHRGGDRQANRALHMIVICRLKTETRSRAFMARKLSEGHSRRDAIRALKRYVARETFNALKTDLSRL